MSNSYKYITYQQRLKIKEMIDSKVPVAKIGDTLGFSRISIYREINKGGGLENYDPDYAQKVTTENLSTRGAERKLEDQKLAAYISSLILEKHMSPEAAIKYMKSNTCTFTNIPSVNTVYRAIDDGLIPGVTRDTFLSFQSKLFNGGQLCIPRWVLMKLGLKDGDILNLEVTDDGKLIYEKKPDHTS